MKQALTRQSDYKYHRFLDHTGNLFAARAQVPLFLTDTLAPLWTTYLESIPAADRQAWNCNCCRHFIERYGSLASVNANGTLSSLVWNENGANPELVNAVRNCRQLVETGRVSSVFVSSESMLGTPLSNGFRHLAVTLAGALVYKSPLKTPGQYMAEKQEDFRILSAALAGFSEEVLAAAIRILKGDMVAGSEKFVAWAEWLRELKIADQEFRKMGVSYRDCAKNKLWLAVAMAPAGWCHPRGSMVGTLLEDLAAGMDFETVRSRWNEKMHPLQYQRPQSAPAAGAIEQAEKTVAALGLERSLARRFAKLEDVVAIWSPRPKEQAKGEGGVFARLKSKPITTSELSGPLMTFAKFSAKVLPEAEEIELLVPPQGDFIALVTAQHADAPPILKWDQADRRNPVSWYRYYNGSPASKFNLIGGRYAKVEAITLMPSHWYGAKSTDDGIIFILKGARDTSPAGLSLFPEILRSELHGVRSVFEAYSKTGTIAGVGEPAAAGIGFDKTHTRIRVRTGNTWTTYTLDRLD